MFDYVKIRDFLTTAAPAAVVWDAMQCEARARWMNHDGDEFEGTVRHGFWTEDGLRDNDVTWKEAHVRITLTSGLDRFVSFEDMVDMRRNFTLFFS